MKIEVTIMFFGPVHQKIKKGSLVSRNKRAREQQSFLVSGNQWSAPVVSLGKPLAASSTTRAEDPSLLSCSLRSASFGKMKLANKACLAALLGAVMQVKSEMTKASLPSFISSLSAEFRAHAETTSEESLRMVFYLSCWGLE